MAASEIIGWILQIDDQQAASTLKSISTQAKAVGEEIADGLGASVQDTKTQKAIEDLTDLFRDFISPENIEDMVGMIEPVLKKFHDELPKAAEKMRPTVEQVKELVDKAKDSPGFFKRVTSFIGGIVDFFTKIITAISTALIAVISIFTFIGKIIGTILSAVTFLIKTVLQIVTLFIGTLLKLIGGLLRASFKILMGLIGVALKVVFGAIKLATKLAFGVIKGAAKLLIGTIKGAFGLVTGSITGVFRIIKGLMAITGIFLIIDFAREILQGAFSPFFDIIKDVAGLISFAIEPIFTQLRIMIFPLLMQFAPLFQRSIFKILRQFIIPLAMAFMPIIIGKAQKIFQFITDFIFDPKVSWKKRGQAVLDWIKGVTKETIRISLIVWSEVVSRWEKFTKWWKEVPAPWIAAKWKVFLKWWNQPGGLDAKWNSIKKWWGEVAKPWIKQQGRDMMTWVKKQWGEMMEWMGKKALDAAISLGILEPGEGLQDILPKWINIAKGWFNGLVKWINLNILFPLAKFLVSQTPNWLGEGVTWGELMGIDATGSNLTLPTAGETGGLSRGGSAGSLFGTKSRPIDPELLERIQAIKPGKWKKLNRGNLDVPLFAEGGIVTEPTLAMIGEAGPEAVVPLTGGGGVMQVLTEIRDLLTNIVDRVDETDDEWMRDPDFDGQKDRKPWQT